MLGIKRKTLYREGKEYLIRWTIFKCRWFSIKLHKTLMSDPADLHDHPWSYISIMLWGGYYEHTQAFGKPTHHLHSGEQVVNIQDSDYSLQQVAIRKWISALAILFRKGNVPHRLEIPEGKYSITLIFTSYRWRPWGFQTKEGWKEHSQARIY